MEMMAFSYCDQLVSVQVAQTVRKIWHSAFAYCNNLEEVFIPDEVEEISGCAFTRCNNLIKFRLPAKYRTPNYILDLIGSDADVDAILAYNRKIECENNQNKKYSIFELETMLEELIEKYSREEIPDTIENIKEDNIDYPILEINSLVVRKHGMKLRKYMWTRNESFFNVTNDSLLSDSDIV
ncbi:MAG: leucine-rich repeat protein [Anaerovoracaceae bacterium]